MTDRSTPGHEGDVVVLARRAAARPARRAAALLSLAGAWACALPPPESVGRDARVVVADVGPEPFHDVDVLFVTDDSGSMAAHAGSLEALFAEFVASLEAIPGGLPGLHVGFLTTDLGAAGYGGIAGCEGEGDGGRLQAVARIAGCAPPDDRFLIDLPNADGTRTRNFAGGLAEALACITPAGTLGCGFEQPLESLRRALDGSVPENDGFLRPEALLAVIFVTDEDDCSASDGTVFSPDPGREADLGPFDSYRCFRWGVRCDEADPLAPGPRTNCVPWEGSPYLHGVARYAAFLQALKGPGRTLVAGVMGAGAPVAVELGLDGDPHLAMQCDGPTAVSPAVRLGALLGLFPGRSRLSSLCEPSLGGPLLDTSLLIADTAAGSPCLLGSILDTDPTVAGLQADCRAYDTLVGDAGFEASTEVPPCAAVAGRPPCHELAEDPAQCGHTESRLAVRVTRSAPRPAGTHLLVECLVP